MKRFVWIGGLLSVVLLVLAIPVHAAPIIQAPCGANAGALGCNGEDPFAVLRNAINIIIFAIGAISVLMVVIGGLRYVLSGGDPSGVKTAKDTILYALIGVAVAILSYSIVKFVIFKVG